MIVTTMYELARRGGGIGVASMCAGGGMGSATVFEVYPALTTRFLRRTDDQARVRSSRSATESVARS